VPSLSCSVRGNAAGLCCSTQMTGGVRIPGLAGFASTDK
jgi:hypothetical protein